MFFSFPHFQLVQIFAYVSKMKKDQRQQRLYVSEANSKQICSIHLRQGSLELEANDGEGGRWKALPEAFKPSPALLTRHTWASVG